MIICSRKWLGSVATENQTCHFGYMSIVSLTRPRLNMVFTLRVEQETIKIQINFFLSRAEPHNGYLSIRNNELANQT